MSTLEAPSVLEITDLEELFKQEHPCICEEEEAKWLVVHLASSGSKCQVGVGEKCRKGIEGEIKKHLSCPPGEGDLKCGNCHSHHIDVNTIEFIPI